MFQRKHAQLCHRVRGPRASLLQKSGPPREEGGTRPGLGSCGWDGGFYLRKKNGHELSDGTGPGWGAFGVAEPGQPCPAGMVGQIMSCWNVPNPAGQGLPADFGEMVI